tara:strand:+ start:418 stop:816 length:399 start_codon:yes stop_codon:yes gene_type:complete
MQTTEIKFNPIILEDWLLKRDENNYTFWIIKNKEKCITGVFEGFDTWSDDKVDNFLTYKNCYYLHGEPCKVKNDDLCMCRKMEENKELIISSVSNESTIENMLYIRKNLHKKIEKLESFIIRSKSMNGINFG